MSTFSPPRFVVRGLAAIGGLLALAAVGFAADHRGSPPPLPVASSAAPLVATDAPANPTTSAVPTASATPSTSAASKDTPAPGVLPDGRVVLNVATEEDLQKLPGIGPSRAKAILALRERRKKFRAISELLRVKGIGRKTLAKLAPKLVLDPPPSTS